MSGNGREPHTSEPSLDELRRIMAAKEVVKERERKRLGRRASGILVAGGLVVVVGIALSSDPPKPVDPAEGHEPGWAATAARIQEQLADPAGTGALNPDAEMAERDAHRGDMKFAMDLIRYVQPEAPRTAPGTAPADRKAAGER